MSMKKDVVARTIAGVLSALIVAGLYWFWDRIGPFFKVTIPSAVASGWGAVLAAIEWLLASASIPRWWYGILLGVLALSVRRLWKRWQLIRQQPAEPSYLDFVEFRRWGIVWRWRWRGRQPVDITGFCPSCDRHIRYTEDRRMFSAEPTVLHCTNCPGIEVQRDGKFSRIINDVSLEIDHAVRSGEWRQHVSAE